MKKEMTKETTKEKAGRWIPYDILESVLDWRLDLCVWANFDWQNQIDTRAYLGIICILGGLDIYPKLVEFAGSGARVPLTGFGNLLAQGVKDEVDAMGAIGILTGGMKAAAGGLTIAIVSAFFMALVAKPKQK